MKSWIKRVVFAGVISIMAAQGWAAVVIQTSVICDKIQLLKS